MIIDSWIYLSGTDDLQALRAEVASDPLTQERLCAVVQIGPNACLRAAETHGISPEALASRLDELAAELRRQAGALRTAPEVKAP